MPDITVQFEFGSDGLASNAISMINNEIAKIQSGILDKPLKLKLDIDPSSIANIQSKITEMADKLGASFGGTFGGSVSSGQSSPIVGAKRIAAATRDTTTAIQKQIESIVGLDRKSKSAEQSAMAMEKAWLKQREQAAKDEAKAIAAEEAAKAKAAEQAARQQAKAAADAAKAEAKAQEKATKNDFTKNLEAQGNAIQAISRKYDEAQNALKNYTAASRSSNQAVKDAYDNIGGIVNAFNILRENVKSGAISYDQYLKDFGYLKGKFAENVSIIKDADAAHKSLGDSIQSTLQKYGQYFTVSRVFAAAVRTMKQMVQQAIAVDDAMTQLQIVTKSSNSEIADYSKTAFQSAKRLGTSVTDVISATTTYARLGYTMKESGTLAELTTMLQGVGDIDAQSAQSAVTAIIKAFNDIDVNNISSVMDKLVAVGNGAPISVSELAEGLNNAGSALSAAGNSFDESVALLTSANAVLQDASKSSTGLRTIAARIRNTKTELDALGETVTEAEYQDIVEALTNITLADGTKARVSLTDVNGELRSTYDIIKDVASVWQYMGANEQAALAETLAGTRQQNVFYSLVENFDEAANAMELMDHASDGVGALQEAYNTFLDSTTAHIEQFKAAFAELSTDLIDSELMNFLIDAGRKIIEVFDGLVKFFGNGGLLGEAELAAGFIAIAKGIKSVFSALKAEGIDLTLDNFFDQAINGKTRNIIKTIAAFETSFDAAGEAAAEAGEQISFFAKAGQGLGAAWSSMSLLGQIGVVITALTLAYQLYDAINVSAEEAAQKTNDTFSGYESAKSKLESVSTELEVASNRMDELNSKGGLTFVEQDELNKLKESVQQLQIAQDLAGKEAGKAARESMSAALDEYNKFYNDKLNATQVAGYNWINYDENYSGSDIPNQIADNMARINQLRQQLSLYNANDPMYQSILDKITAEEDIVWEYVRNANNLIKILDALPDNILGEEGRNALNDLKSQVDYAYALLDPEKFKQMQFDNLFNNNALSDMRDQLVELSKAEGDAGITVDDLKDKFPYLASAIEEAGLNLDDFVDSINSAAKADISKQIDEQADSIKKRTEETKNYLDGISEIQNILSSQGAGKTMSAEVFASDAVKEYGSALEYVNGVYQLNIEKVNELVSVKSEQLVKDNELAKVAKQQQYLENARQIEIYRNQLKYAADWSDGASDAIQRNIDSLLQENEVIRNECSYYDLLNASIRNATSAYNAFIEAKNAPKKNEMTSGVSDALDVINGTLNDSSSSLFGRVGELEYKAAVEFIIPDSIDSEDRDAINAYLKDINDYFVKDKNGNVTGLDSKSFIDKAVSAGLMNLSEDGKSYSIADGVKFDDFVNKLKLSSGLVKAFFGELESYGGKFDWSDESTNTLGDLAVKATEASEALRKLSEYKDFNFVLDVSGFDKENAVKTLDSTIEKIKRIRDSKIRVNADSSEIKNLNTMLEYAIRQKQMLNNPDVMSVNTDGISDDDIRSALKKLQAYQNALNNLELSVELGFDESKKQAAEDDVKNALADIQQNAEIMAKIEVDPSSENTIKSSINALTVDKIITLGVDSSLIESALEEKEFTAKGTCVWKDDVTKLSKSFSAIGYVTWVDANNPNSPGGTSDVSGSANSSGSANMRGDWRTSGGTSLVGELGREIIVDPNTGRWYTVGDNGAEFVNIPDGAIVFNHLQSEALLKDRKINGRGKSFASGSAFVSGGGAYPPPSSSGSNSSSGSSGYTPPGSSSGDEKKGTEIVDWIEIAIDRIERAINRLSITAGSTFKSLQRRLSASNDEISKVYNKIDIMSKAYDRYIAEANKVSLSDDLKEQVRNGTIDINKYSKKTQDLIKKYQEWYEKALDCSDAIDELHENLGELYKENFDNIQKDFDNKLSFMERQAKTFNNRIDMLEEQGYMQNADYYKRLRGVQKSSVGVLNQELASLQSAFNDAMASGEIEEGSEAWYDMKFAIEDTKAAIEEAEIAIIKYDNTLRQIQWDYFDYAQERIGQITSEADFLLNLLDGKNMYDENGNLSETGIAAGGLHAEKYGIYMAQADKYAEEIKRINAEIANDPNNTNLIKRRDELVASQRDAILAAKSEKEALVDLAREGINVELEAVKKLIDAYTESLDSAKDLYDYQKKIADKTKNIATLEKQIAAYQNDVSEETRSKIQKIQVQLADAKDELKETEYERLISDSKKLLDNLYTEYEDVLNSRFDDIDATFEKLIGLTNDNFVSINEYLSEIADGVGYVISDEGQSVWSLGGGVNGFVSVYGKDITTKLTATGIVVENIFGLLGAIAKQNGVDFPAAKSYASGGLIDYTGTANVHGSARNPELVLSASDTKNFIMLRDALREVDSVSLFNAVRTGIIGEVGTGRPHVAGLSSNAGGYSVGAINVTIPIERVEDYNDFVNQLKGDKQFEKMVQEFTIGRVAGKSKLSKNKFNW